jgi:hypothetical protein
MAHTYTNLIFHIVFSTQGHLPIMKPEFRQELFAYLGSLLKEKGWKTDHHQRRFGPCSFAYTIAA